MVGPLRPPRLGPLCRPPVHGLPFVLLVLDGGCARGMQTCCLLDRLETMVTGGPTAGGALLLQSVSGVAGCSMGAVVGMVMMAAAARRHPPGGRTTVQDELASVIRAACARLPAAVGRGEQGGRAWFFLRSLCRDVVAPRSSGERRRNVRGGLCGALAEAWEPSPVPTLREAVVRVAGCGSFMVTSYCGWCHRTLSLGSFDVASAHLPVTQATLASCAIPVVCAGVPLQLRDGCRHHGTDGGMLYPNPALLVAATYAAAFPGLLPDLHVVSLGTGTSRNSSGSGEDDLFSAWGLPSDLASVLCAGRENDSDSTLRGLLGEKHYHRVDWNTEEEEEGCSLDFTPESLDALRARMERRLDEDAELMDKLRSVAALLRRSLLLNLCSAVLTLDGYLSMVATAVATAAPPVTSPEQ